MSAGHRAAAELGAAVLGLTLTPEHLEGVAANLALLERHAAVVLALGLELGPGIEPAPVFAP